jgi:hypothetical protein
MPSVAAFRDGIRRVNEAPLLLAGVALTTLSMAIPLSLALRGMLEAHLGSSAVASAAAGDVTYGWWQEFAAQATGLGTTFTPSILGFAAVLENTSALLDNQPLAATIAGVTGAWLVAWSFLSGGVLDRYARRRPTRAHGFFAACGTHFWRFLRLGAIAWLVYAALFGVVHGWIFEWGYARLVRDVTVERTAFLLRLAGYGLFVAFLAICATVFDFARVRIVIEDRRSAIGALLAGARFVGGRAGAVFRLYALNASALLVLAGLYAAAPAGIPPGIQLWIGIAAAEIYIIGRHYLKLLVYASETALFQGSLAHAAYAAAPMLEWPDSPAVESITNAPRRTP